MSVTSSILLGVVSGVLTSALLWLGGILFRDSFLPWYRAQRYSGVDISGTWTSSADPPGKTKAIFELFLKQAAHDLKGSATIIQGADLENPSSIHSMDVSGSVWEGFVTLNLQSKDKTRLSYATSLLQVKNGGVRLKGYLTYRSIQTDTIRTQEMRWERTNKS